MKRGLRLMMIAGLLSAVGAWADGAVVLEPETSHVDITADFAGTDLKTFGVIDTPGDLIIKIVGPQQNVTLSREVKFGPFWIGGGKAKVAGAPSLLFLYATRPIAALLSREERDKYGLRFEGVPLRVEAQLFGDSADDWRRAFIRLKKKEHDYLEDDHAIRITRNRLIVSDIVLPGDLAIGNYQIETLLVKSGRVIGHDVSHFEVRQVGVERWVWNAARNHSWLFGVVCTLAAMLLGFTLNAAFHRD